MRAICATALALTPLAGCDSGDDASVVEPLAYDPHPEPPAILRDVSMVADDNTWNNPFIPGHRTSADGRVAIRVQGGPPGGARLSTALSFFLFVPERLEAPVMPGPAGAEILADPTPFDVVFPPALDPSVQTLGHHAICDATEEFAVPGERTNPYPCGDGGLANDCYDLTIVSSTMSGLTVQLWGTPITVEVAEPKTSTAHIVRAELGEPVAGGTIPASPELTEPAVTIDGRLLTGRLGRLERDWTNPNTGETLRRAYDLAYSLLPADSEPCDVTGWTDFHPMSHAPFDATMRHYGIAAYPFRDSEGRLIADGEDLGGTYPWVDREGANVFMAGVVGRIAEQSETQYPRRCVLEGCDSYEENRDWDRGFMVAGLWTHGKFVHLDGLINNLDWTVGVAPETHWMVDLYRDRDGDPVAVRFGAGRFIDGKRGGIYPPGYTQNPNILDSLQNLPNHAAMARTVTPRDVVWLMSTGVATDEVAFDDFLDPQALIVSNMQASITQYYDENGASLSIPRHWNGQVRRFDDPISLIQLSIVPATLVTDAASDIHIQNGATSLTLEVPPYGLVEAGTGRAEPVALGGIRGRGFWLSGENRIRYAMPDNPGIEQADIYVGIFVDPRTTEGASRALSSFADGSSLRLIDGATVQYLRDGRRLHRVELPAATGWLHLGLRVRDGGHDITLLHDGFALDRYPSDEPLFQPLTGELVVGRAGDDDAGVRGWIDDFKVLAHDVNPEVACNHAGGTLIRVDDNATWQAVASPYPAWAHAEIAALLGDPEGTTYACFHDYTGDYAAHLGNIPSGTTSLREAINFPEGPLHAGAPRPDSSGNPFCLSCHSAAGIGGLGLGALEYRPNVVAENDPRRQPLQAPRRVFGNVPGDWIPPGDGPGSPARSFQAPPQGTLVDPWLLPAAGPENPR